MMKLIVNIIFLFFIFFNASYGLDKLELSNSEKQTTILENRFSFLFGINPSLTNYTDITNLNFSYGKKLDDYWIDTNIIMTNGVFNKLTTNNQSATGLTTEELVDSKSSLITIGAGVGRESNYFQKLLPFNGVSEIIATDLTYNIYKEKNSGLSFTGLGMIAKFSLQKKISDYFKTGVQLSYNLSPLKRSANDDNESSSSRSLTLSYLTIGFDLSFYL